MNPVDLIWLLAPEIILAIGGSAVLLLGLTRLEAGRSIVAPFSVVTLLAALAVVWYAGMPGEPAGMLGIRITNFVWFIRLAALIIGLIVLLVHWRLPAAGERGDMFGMILFSLTGILLTSAADDLVVLFLALELVSVPTYVLVSVGRSDVRAQEAGVKYFFLGAMSSAMLVYGLSFLYGASGTTTLTGMTLAAGSGYATLGLLLAFAGLAYKVAAVPFHAYAPDVYQGAASPVTGLLGFFPKVAGFVALTKLLLVIQPPGPITDGWLMPPLAFAFLWLVAALTMTVGNVLGLLQTNVKRILAYSSIAHSGYILIALLAGPVAGAGPLRDGLSAMLFYIVVYGVMNLGAFVVLALLERDGRPAEELDDLVGLARRQPLTGLAMAICIFSLMGMPPTAGFFAKLYIFSSALSAGPNHPHQMGLIWLVIVGVINAAIAAAYYLRIVATCYLRDEDRPTTLTPQTGPLRLGLAICCALILLIGLWPHGLIRAARQPLYDLQPPIALVHNPEDTASSPADPARPAPPVARDR